MRLSIFAAAALALVGCANQARQQAFNQVKASEASCRAQYPMAVGTAHARMECNYAAITSDPYLPSWLTEMAAQRVIWGQQVDAGTLSLDQARLMDAQLKAQIDERQHQEAMQQEEVNAERTQAAAAVMAAVPPPQAYVAPFQPVQWPTIAAPQTVRTNCMAFGSNQVSCTSQ